ncbi:MAG: hypothetical protein ACLPKI_05040 [Streptosporangiaceae bacterium]
MAAEVGVSQFLDIGVGGMPSHGRRRPDGTTPTLGGTPPAHPSVPPLSTATDGPLAVGLVYASQQCTG